MIDAGRDQDRRGAHADRLHRLVDRLEALAGPLDREGRALLRGGGGGDRDGEQGKNATHGAGSFALHDARGEARWEG